MQDVLRQNVSNDFEYIMYEINSQYLLRVISNNYRSAHVQLIGNAGICIKNCCERFSLFIFSKLSWTCSSVIAYLADAGERKIQRKVALFIC